MGRYAILIIMLLLAAPVYSQTTSLRQQRIFEGDIAELTITLDTKIASLYALDTTPLERDFEVLEQRSRITQVQQQGQMLHRLEWRVFVLPRRTGKLTIPALKFGNNYSTAMSLEVSPVSAGMQHQALAFVEIEAFPRNPYPGQQTRIVMRLLHNSPTLEGSLIEPKFDSAQVFRGGIDLNYLTSRDGNSFTVLERSLLITPETADPMQPFSASFRGTIDAPHPGLLETDEIKGKRHIYRRSEPLQLQVRELPDGVDAANWLPASRLEVDLQWDKIAAAARVGESLGLTLTLRADGLPGDLLPANLLLSNPGQLRIFADQEIRDTRVEHSARDLKLSGQLQQRYAIILDRAGEVTLPQLQLPWWDVDADMARVETLQPVSLTVIDTEAIDGPTDDKVSNHSLTGGQTDGSLPQSLTQHWPWIGLLTLAAILLFLSKRLQQRLLKSLPLAQQRRQRLRRLRNACLAGDADTAHPALIAWARLHWQDRHLSGLRSIALRAGTRDWSEQLLLLDAARYSAAAQDWNGHTLWQMVRSQATGRAESGSASKPRLPDLYPRVRRVG
jgi:hypothetical protein